MAAGYPIYLGQPLADGEVLQRMRRPGGGVDVVMTVGEARDWQRALEIMDRNKNLLAMLAKN
jgi:hypothetical protein